MLPRKLRRVFLSAYDAEIRLLRRSLACERDRVARLRECDVYFWGAAALSSAAAELFGMSMFTTQAQMIPSRNPAEGYNSLQLRMILPELPDFASSIASLNSV
jgi:hypothetical protein